MCVLLCHSFCFLVAYSSDSGHPVVDLKDYKDARTHLYHVLRQNPDSENALALIMKLDKHEVY